MEISIVLLASLLPPLLLTCLIYRMDKVEKEPPKLIIKLILFGALSTFLAIALEVLVGKCLIHLVPTSSWAFTLINYFVGVALIEELTKFIFLKKLTWKHPAFDYTFDGVVYAVAVSLGFAAFENLMYVSGVGIWVAVVRAVTAIPGHFIYAIYMGISYGMAKKAEVQGRNAAKNGNLFKALLVPTLLHGFYDYSASVGEKEWIIIFLVFVTLLYVVSIRRVRKVEREDSRIYDETAAREESSALTKADAAMSNRVDAGEATSKEASLEISSRKGNEEAKDAASLANPFEE